MRWRGRVAVVMALVPTIVTLVPAVALAHENQVIRFGSFLGGLTHPVLGLDHFLAMVSVGIVSSMIGGRALWAVPGLFVLMMGVGGVLGRVNLGLGSTAIEVGIALSVVLLGVVIVLDTRLPVRLVMLAVVFFGFFHGYAHGVEIPDVARPVTYALGFLTGTALIHLLGVLIGEVAKRYTSGRLVLRVASSGFVVLGGIFLLAAI